MPKCRLPCFRQPPYPGGDRGADAEGSPGAVQLELSMDVLCRLVRERSLVASEFRCLNPGSSRAGWLAIKTSVAQRSRREAGPGAGPE